MTSLNQEYVSNLGRDLYALNQRYSAIPIVEHFKNIFNKDYQATMDLLNAAKSPDVNTKLNMANLKNTLESNTGDAFLKMCGVKDFGTPNAPANAEMCVKLITKCVEGDSKCLDVFEDLANKLEKGIDFSNLKNSEAINNLLKGLGIDVNEKEPINKWLGNLKIKAGSNSVELAAIDKIAKNEGLKTILNNFIVVVRKPESAVNKSVRVEELAKLNRFGLYPRVSKRNPMNIKELKERIERRPIGRINQSGGGDDDMTDNEARFYDNLKNNYMIGGSSNESYKLTAPLLRQKYNDYVSELASKEKKILESDDARIQKLFNDFELMEKEVNNIVFATLKVKELKNREDLNSKDKEIAINTIKKLAEQHDKAVVEYNQKGLSIVDILRCIRDGCNEESINKLRQIPRIKANARIEDIRSLFNPSKVASVSPTSSERSPSPKALSPKALSPKAVGQKNFFW